jgi:hypothetical protein
MTGRSLRAAANLIEATFAADPARVERVLAALDPAALAETLRDLLGVLNLWMGSGILAEADGHPADHVLDTYLTARIRHEADLLRRAARLRDIDGMRP